MLISLLFWIGVSCKKDRKAIVPEYQEDVFHKPLHKLNGEIQIQFFSYHQYGTHYIISDSTYYALKSTSHNLDDYVGIDTTLIGKQIPGYPLNPGTDPDYIEVIDFE